MKKEAQQVLLYKVDDGTIALEVKLQDDTVWLNQYQLAVLFKADRTSVLKHIKNVYKTHELDEKSTCAKIAQVQKEGTRTLTRRILYYNLDMIIAIGYRINSKRGTQFRIWANKILKDYLVKGFAVNEKRLQEKSQQLEELKKVIQLQEKVLSAHTLQTNEATGLLHVISEYSRALEVLDDYDHQRLLLPETKSKSIHKITYSEAKKGIKKLGEQTGVSTLFGKEKDDSFKGSLENIYQTFDGKELYPSIEEKAANLLYFVVKNHSFTDGNKRIAAFLFVWFLDLNEILYNEHNQKQLEDNALVALTLMIAESNPNDKDMMIKVVVNLIYRK